MDDNIPLPNWLEIHDFDDLKSSLVGIIIVVIAVAFLGQVIDWKGGSDIAYFGGEMCIRDRCMPAACRFRSG